MHRLALSILLLLTLGVHAQEKGRTHVRFLAERIPPNLAKVVMADGEKGAASKPFTLPVNFLSEPAEVPSRSFQIRPEQGTAPIATVQLPEQGEAFIVLLVTGESGYQSIVIPAGDASFKTGDVYFYNHTTDTVMGYVGTTKFSIPRDKGQVVKPGGAHPEKFYDVAFGVREDAGDRVLSTTRWPVDEQSRSYVFFFKNPASDRVEYRAVDEFVPPPETKGQPKS